MIQEPSFAEGQLEEEAVSRFPPPLWPAPKALAVGMQQVPRGPDLSPSSLPITGLGMRSPWFCGRACVWSGGCTV